MAQIAQTAQTAQTAKTVQTAQIAQMVPSSKFDASPSVDFGQRYTLASDTLQLGKAYIAVLLAQMWKKSAKISDFFILWKLWDFLICKILTSKQFFWPKIISTLYNVWFWLKMSRFSSHFANGHIKSNPERSLAILQVKHDWDMSVLGWVTVCLPPFFVVSFVFEQYWEFTTAC